MMVSCDRWGQILFRVVGVAKEMFVHGGVL